MKKRIAILLCICLILGLAACGKSDVGGLGQLVIGKDDDVTSPTSGGNGIPDLGGNGESTPSPTPKGSNNPTFPASTPTPTPVTSSVTPTPANAPGTLTTSYYQDKNIAMRIPTGWTVNCQTYNAGGGLQRLFCCIYDPEDPTSL